MNKNGVIYIQFEGQLCNQMFQVFTGYALSKKFNKELVFFYNPNKQWEYRNVDYFKDFKLMPTDYSLIRNCQCFNEIMHFEYREINLDPLKDYYFRCYFQNEKYFKEYRMDLYNLFFNQELLDSLKTKFPKWENSYFIHYRRTDYIGNGGLNIQLENYFPPAIKTLEPEAHFYVCSDDIDYCKFYFKDLIKNKTFVETLEPIETLHLMSICNLGAICSNSSFSWMGSYFNMNPSKKVLFPEIWLNDNSKEIDIWFEGSIKIPLLKKKYKSFVINLKRRPDRLELFRQTFSEFMESGVVKELAVFTAFDSETLKINADLKRRINEWNLKNLSISKNEKYS